MKKFYLLFLILLAALSAFCIHPAFRLQAGQKVTLACDPAEENVVHSAIGMLRQDLQAVLSTSFGRTTNPRQANIIAGTWGKSRLIAEIIAQSKISADTLVTQKEAFLLTIIHTGARPSLLVIGSDKRGTAYGILELSRLLGVSPWEWWADVHPAPRKSFTLPGDFRRQQSPAVEYRGIFLNDEDWGLTPWSWQTHEPSPVKGRIGPRTHERIFQLLLRLRANTFWPAMHTCSVPFYFTPGNKEMAGKYGIYIGTSHCEPMMRNSNGEWKTDGQGEYDYVHNRNQVLQFWEKRITEVAGSDNIYTLGIRGVHDGKMQGAKTIKEQKNALTRILADQRDMLARLVNPELNKIPQVFIPYKEVLDVYHAGLEIPDDITLMWCDDNYGYIRHFPDSLEQKRNGGNGIYYHISYWGRPHDYLWLGTTHPALICNQLQQAYQAGIQKLWILNAGDIKPLEYLTELVMDLAWDPHALTSGSLTLHLTQWLEREFGKKIATQTSPLLQEYYRLAYICRPEFLGHTRVEEKDPAYQIVHDLPWSEHEIGERLTQYQHIAARIKALSHKIPPLRKDAWFQLVQYPVLAACEMNKKILYAQLARHQKADWSISDQAYDNLAALTATYNSLNEGKWNRMMDFQPRNLPVFQPIPHVTTDRPLTTTETPLQVFNGTDYVSSTGSPHWTGGLGYQGQAIVLPAGSSITFRVKLRGPDSIRIETTLVPTHPVHGKELRFQITTHPGNPQDIAYQTRGRSEEWKQNVLRNQAIRMTCHRLQAGKIHSITLKALDEDVLIDQVRIYPF